MGVSLERVERLEDVVKDVPEWIASWLLFKEGICLGEVTPTVVSNGIVCVIDEESAPALELLYLPLRQDATWVVGTVMSCSGKGEVLEDERHRFCWSVHEQYDNKFASILSPEGVLTLKRMSFDEDGEIRLTSRSFTREPFHPLYDMVARAKQDCQFCFFRKQPCECAKTMKSRAKDFAAVLRARMATTKGHNSWDLFRNVLLGMILERYVALVEVYDSSKASSTMTSCSAFPALVPGAIPVRRYWRYCSISFLTPYDAQSRENGVINSTFYNNLLSGVTSKDSPLQETVGSSSLTKETNGQVNSTSFGGFNGVSRR